MAACRVEPDAAADGSHAELHWHWLNDRPVFWTVLVVVALVGAAYFALVQRTKPSHLQAPEGEVFATEAPESPAVPTTP